MNLSSHFILRPVMTILVTVAIIIAGMFAFKNLPISNLPDVDYPTITVTAVFPGANPTTMANTIATPLEKQFMAIQDVRYVTSSNVIGSSTIIIVFDTGKDIDLAAVDVQAAIAAAKPLLPPDIPQDPTFKKVNPSSAPVIYLSVTSPTLRDGELYDYANTLVAQQITVLPGVAQVVVYGSPSAVRAQVDPGYIASLDITLDEISNSLYNDNQYQPLGQFDGDYTASTIYDNGGRYNAEAFEPMTIVYRNGSPVRLSSVGHVLNSLKNDRGVRLYIDQNVTQASVTIAVQQQPGANVVQVAEEVNRLIATIKDQIPASVQLKVVFDRSLAVKNAIHDVEITLLIAFALVVLVIFIYLGDAKATIIPTVVMPMSIIGTFIVIFAFGYNLDNLSLLALTLSIGFIVDDAIVVLENIVRHVEDGENLLDASINGSKQISFTIVSMTLSLIAVFLPLIFMAGFIGILFREFSITLAVVTIISGIISLTLTPTMCRHFISEDLLQRKGFISKASTRFNQFLLRHYETSLNWVLNHRPFMLAIGIVSVVISLLLFKVLPTDFIPDDDIGFIIAYTESEQGTSSEQMAKYQLEVIDVLKQQKEISTMVSISATPVFRQGIIFMSLLPRSKRANIVELMQDWNKKLSHIAGVNVFLKNVPLIDLNVGSQVRGAYQYIMQGLDDGQVYNAADKLIEKMRNDPIFVGISTDLEIKTPQIILDIDRDQAYALGINPANFERALFLSYSGNRVSRIQTPIDQYDVILEQSRNLQRTPLSLNDIYLRSDTTKKLVPLNAVATLKDGVGPASINHFSQFPAVTITFSLLPNIPLSEALDKLQKFSDEIAEVGVTGKARGAAEVFQEAIQSIALLLIVTIIVIYIVLGILYESFIHPLTILSTLPPAIVGGLLILYVTGKPLSVYAFLGIILLIGIVKKNGIMIVDFALDNIRIKGESAEKSIYDACIVRFRPIMMTTLAAIMGAVPIAIGIGDSGESKRPLGFVIIGGMCVSQLITLYLTPVIYLYLEQLSERFSARKTRKAVE